MNKLHFLRLAARAMRCVLVDHARANMAQKRGSSRKRVTLNEDLAELVDDAGAVLEVHDGLEALGEMDPQLVDIVEMRFFGGMSMVEIAGVLDVSESTVHRGLRLIRAWWMEEYQPDIPADE